jgi:hypothetical protein
MELAVQIVRFVDDAQPGVVAAEFVDAVGRSHTLIDKVSIFSEAMLNAASAYPQPGAARCEVLIRKLDAQKREIVRISTLRPDAIESTEGLSEFEVLSPQLSPRKVLKS